MFLNPSGPQNRQSCVESVNLRKCPELGSTPKNFAMWTMWTSSLHSWASCGLWTSNLERKKYDAWSKGDHSHMPCSHNCDHGQSAVNGPDGFLAAHQRSKYHKTVKQSKLASFLDLHPAFCQLHASAVNAALLSCLTNKTLERGWSWPLNQTSRTCIQLAENQS